MSDQFKGIEPMVYNSKINVPYSWWAGDTASKFYITLRDEKKIMDSLQQSVPAPAQGLPVLLH